MSVPQTSPAGKISIQVVEGQNAINNISRNTAYEPVVEVQDASNRPSKAHPYLLCYRALVRVGCLRMAAEP